MEKREKIIVIISVVAGIYGVLDFFVFSKNMGGNDAINTTNNSEIVATITTQLSSQAVGGDVLGMIERINTSWPKGTFFNAPPSALFAEEEKQEDIKGVQEQFDPDKFKYTGYLEMGANKIAIINGRDYIMGDEVNGGTLSNIAPLNIEITLQGERFDIEIQPAETVKSNIQNSSPVKIKTIQY